MPAFFSQPYKSWLEWHRNAYHNNFHYSHGTFTLQATDYGFEAEGG